MASIWNYLIIRSYQGCRGYLKGSGKETICFIFEIIVGTINTHLKSGRPYCRIGKNLYFLSQALWPGMKKHGSSSRSSICAFMTSSTLPQIPLISRISELERIVWKTSLMPPQMITDTSFFAKIWSRSRKEKLSRSNSDLLITRLSSKSSNNSRVQVSKTGETRELKMGMAIRYMIASNHSAGIFFPPVTQHSCRSRQSNSSKANLSDK